MTLIAVNDLDVHSGTVSVPRIGAWHADLLVDSTDDVSGDCEISINDGALKMKGTAYRHGSFVDTSYLRIVAGKDGLRKLAKPKFYSNIPVRTVLSDLAQAGGEKLASDLDPAVGSVVLSSWTVLEMPIGQAIAALIMAVPDAVWRMKVDGSLWAGKESWPDAGLDDFQQIDRFPSEGRAELGVVAPTLQPGTKLDGDRVSYVEHRIKAATMRSFVWFEDSATLPQDRAKQSLMAVARASRPRLEYQAHYRARVVKQSGDGLKVDLDPDDGLLPNMSDVPLRQGIPGCVAKFNPGAFVLVGWESGDPTKPMAHLFDDGATITEIAIGGALAESLVTKKDLQFLYFAINSAAVVAMDGGASFKAAILATLGAGGWSSNPGDAQLGSAKIKVAR